MIMAVPWLWPNRILGGMIVRNVLSAAVVSLCAGAASAEIVTNTVPFTLGVPGSTTVFVPSFDDSLGTLTRVTLTISAAIRAQVTAENQSTQNNQFTTRISGSVSADGPGDLDANATMSFLSQPINVGPSDGVALSGPDFANFGTVSAAGTAAQQLNGGFEAFTGPAMPVLVSTIGQFRVSGEGNSTIKVGSFGADGAVIVTYEYSPIPTPGAAALLGVGGLLALRRRR